MAFSFLTDDAFRTAIQAQEREFDSHDVILWFYRFAQAAYVREAERASGTYPVTELNRQIGLALLRYPDLIEKIGERESRTIGGELRPCALWRKR